MAIIHFKQNTIYMEEKLHLCKALREKPPLKVLSFDGFAVVSKYF